MNKDKILDKQRFQLTFKESLWQEFLEAYLKNVKEKLPQSYRAGQLEHGTEYEKSLVYKFETMFLRKPFEKAIDEVLAHVKDLIEEWAKEQFEGAFHFICFEEDINKLLKNLEAQA